MSGSTLLADLCLLGKSTDVLASLEGWPTCALGKTAIILALRRASRMGCRVPTTTP